MSGEPNPGIARLFELGAKSTPPAVAEARKQHESLKREHTKSARLDYAFALVLVNQHRYRDALPLVVGYLEANPNDLAARRTKIWIELQERQYSVAMDDCASLADLLPRPPVRNADKELADSARFLGTVFGYLELIKTNVVDVQQRTDCKTRVLTSLGDTTAAFDEGRGLVVERLAALEQQRHATREQTATQLKKEREQFESELDEQRSNAAAEHETAQSSGEQLRESQRELSVIEQQLTTLNQYRARLSAQMIALQAQMIQLAESLGYPNPFLALTGANVAQLPGQQPPTLQQLRGGPSAVAPTLNPAWTNFRDPRVTSGMLSLVSLNKQAFDIDRQIVTLANRAAELNGKQQKQVADLERSEQAADRAAQRAKAVERQLERQSDRPAPAGGTLTGKMAALATYAPFPYEREKKRVLGWFTR
jgi:hypothetical protein